MIVEENEVGHLERCLKARLGKDAWKSSVELWATLKADEVSRDFSECDENYGHNLSPDEPRVQYLLWLLKKQGHLRHVPNKTLREYAEEHIEAGPRDESQPEFLERCLNIRLDNDARETCVEWWAVHALVQLNNNNGKALRLASPRTPRIAYLLWMLKKRDELHLVTSERLRDYAEQYL